MVANTKTRNHSANGGMQVSPIDFSVEFSIPDPTDINSMKSKIVFPDEDDIEDDDEEVDFGTRVLRFRKRELLRELQEIKKLEQEAQQDDDEDEIEDEDDFDRRRLPIRGRR